MSTLDRGMGLALAGLRQLAGLAVIDRLGQRERVERIVHGATRHGFGAATTVARTFSGAGKRTEPARQQQGDDPRLFDLRPTEEQAMLVEAFRGFADDALRSAAREADDDCDVPPDLAGGAAQLGALVLGIPTALGGVVDERSSVTAMLAAEALAHGDLGLAAGILSPAAVATAIGLWGTAAQQETYLPAFAGDEPPVAALAVQEPRPAFDPMAPSTTARRAGAELVLDGTKSSVLRVAQAELFLVAADLEGTPVVVIVEGGTEGLTQAPEPAMGVRAAGTGTLQLDGVRVPVTNLLGGPDTDIMPELVARSRVAWAALAVGTGQAVLDYVVPYVNEREAFGEPISHRQSVAFMVSDIAIELDGLRLVTQRAASLMDQGRDARRVAALARQLTTTKAMQIGNDGVQLLGGHGYVKEHPVERWYRDLRVAGVLEGALLV